MILLTVGIYSILAPDVIKAIRMEVVSVVLGYNNWWQISENADYFTRMANQSPFTHLWFLGIELQYYLLWPLLFGLYNSRFQSAESPGWHISLSGRWCGSYGNHAF